MKRNEIRYLVVGLLMGAIVGGLLGEIIGSFLPDGTAKTLFMKSVPVGFKPFTLELYAMSLTFGLLLKFNFVSVLMMIFVLAYFRWWYL